jgi:hypothetical protein
MPMLIRSFDLRSAWRETERLLFEGVVRVRVEDAGDNWNALFQEAHALPENTELERGYKHFLLATLYTDFTSTAVM